MTAEIEGEVIVGKVTIVTIANVNTMNETIIGEEAIGDLILDKVKVEDDHDKKQEDMMAIVYMKEDNMIIIENLGINSFILEVIAENVKEDIGKDPL